MISPGASLSSPAAHRESGSRRRGRSRAPGRASSSLRAAATPGLRPAPPWSGTARRRCSSRRTCEASVARAVELSLARFGRLDVAGNSAGAGGDLASLEATNQDVWDTVMAVNARGVWLAMRHEIPAMLGSGGGAIVNMGSIYSVAGKAAHHAYVASKHAVVGMTRSVALEYASRGIRVNAICAGVTRTPGMVQAEMIMPDIVRQLVAEHPIGRMATEEEIAAAAVWLCSDAAGFVTGTPLAVDGGFLAA
jgi:NAD(P)-dependent dehydrogenase (short-subunit alcohol dehydrogenase family)